MRLMGRAWVWLSIATATVMLVGMSAIAVLALAHHAAPVGGGG
jgi:hypothetical protein